MIHTTISIYVEKKLKKDLTIECYQKTGGTDFFHSLKNVLDHNTDKYKIDNPTQDKYNITFDKYPSTDIYEEIIDLQRIADNENYQNDEDYDANEDGDEWPEKGPWARN